MGIVTVEKLENADKDADSLEKFVEGGRTEVVKTRKNKEYPTLQNAVYQVIETGGFEPFATEEELLKSTPILEKKAAKALDTRKVFLWSNGVWIDTGLSEKDLAIAHSDAEIAKTSLSLSTKLDVLYDFHTYNLLPDFIQVDEKFKIINIKENIDLIILDFFNYDLNPTLILINENGKILNETDKSFLYDFFTYDLNPTIITIDAESKIIEFATSSGSQDIDFDDLPISEANSESLFFDKQSVKHIRKYHPIYFQTQAQAIPRNNAQNVYTFFDELMTENTNYITKTQMGLSTLGVPMYQYKFKPASKRISASMSQEQVRPVRIMINAGIHGSERNGIIAVMCFAYNLVKNWRELEYYDDLRMHCEFVITPMMNIDGTNNITRTNANGVDCNRNFDWNWENGGTSTTGDNYRGTAPFSEIESQNYRDAVLAYPNADLYVDVHHGGEAEILWIGSNIQENVELLTNAGTEISTYFHKHINPNLDPQTQLLFISTNGDGTAAGYLAANGYSSVLFEGVDAAHKNIETVFNSRRFNEYALLKIIYHGFARAKAKRELTKLI